LATDIVLVDKPLDNIPKKEVDVYDETIFIQIEK